MPIVAAKSLALPMGTASVGVRLQRQRAEMAMDRAIAAKNQRCIGLVGGIEFVAREDVDARQFKWPDVFLVREGRHMATARTAD